VELVFFVGRKKLSRGVKIRRFVFHTFTVTTEPDVNLFDVRRLFWRESLFMANLFYEVAKRYNGVIEKRSGIDIAAPEPRIRITTTNLGKNEFTVIAFSTRGYYLASPLPLWLFAPALITLSVGPLSDRWGVL
jgi:hypothetical protein